MLIDLGVGGSTSQNRFRIVLAVLAAQYLSLMISPRSGMYWITDRDSTRTKMTRYGVPGLLACDCGMYDRNPDREVGWLTYWYEFVPATIKGECSSLKRSTVTVVFRNVKVNSL